MQNIVVVVTGASSGIGRAVALAFAEQGARLVLASRREAVLQEVAAECGGECLVVPTDVTDAEAVQRLADQAVAQFGQVDVWVNCAVVAAVGEFTQTPMAAHEQTVRVGLLGCMNGAHAILPHFRERGRGRLINLNSVGAWVPAPYVSAYSAIKFGMRGFSEALRGELRQWPDIRVCDVFPSFVDTPAFQKAGNYVGRELKPIPPLIHPTRVAREVVALWENPRDVTMIGASLARLAHWLAPDLVRNGMVRLMEGYFKVAPRVAVSEGNLYRGSGGHDSVEGGWSQRARRKLGLLALGGTLALGAGWLLLREPARKDSEGPSPK